MKSYRESKDRFKRQMNVSMVILCLIALGGIITIGLLLTGCSGEPRKKPKTFKYGISYNDGWEKSLTNSYKLDKGNYVFTDQDGITVTVPEKKVEFIVCPKEPYIYNE